MKYLIIALLSIIALWHIMPYIQASLFFYFIIFAIVTGLILIISGFLFYLTKKGK